MRSACFLLLLGLSALLALVVAAAVLLLPPLFARSLLHHARSPECPPENRLATRVGAGLVLVGWLYLAVRAGLYLRYSL